MRARRDGVCPRCGFSFPAGTEITKLSAPHWGWGHGTCPSSEKDAQKAADKTLKTLRREDSAKSHVKDGKFSLSFSYDPEIVSIVKGLPQRKFDKDDGLAKWWIAIESYGDLIRALQASSSEASHKLANDLIEGSRFSAARDLRDKAEEKLKASRAAEVDGDFEVRCPAGLAYKPFQLAFISWAFSVTNILLGDEMGLGKTIQALGLINARPSTRRVLIVCPSSLRYNWRNEAQKWLVDDYKISVIEGTKGWPATTTGNHVVIINFDVAKRNAKKLHAFEWDLFIVDEAHLLKNSKTQRARALLGYYDKTEKAFVPGVRAKRSLFMTGTPIPNRIEELWNLVTKLDPEGLGRNWKLFMTRYAAAYQELIMTPNGAKYIWHTDGASNLEELQTIMRSRFMMRRLKSQVAKELPPKMRRIIAIPPNGASKLVKREQAISSQIDQQHDDIEIHRILASITGDKSYQSTLDGLAMERLAAFEEMSQIRHDLAIEKVPYVVEHVRNAVTSSGKIVLFAWHRDVIEALRAQLEAGSQEHDPIRCVTLVGGMSAAAASDAVESFQTDPDVEVFIGNIQAAGVGHTLTASSYVVFAELPWRPCDASQAEDRTHRFGQEAEVITIDHMLFEGTMDVYMANMLIAKQAVADSALDDLGADAPDFETTAIDSRDFQVKFHASVFEASRVREEKAEKAEKKSQAKAAKRQEVLRVAKVLTPEQIEAVHECLRSLASVCDGAQAQDFMGFNAIDTRIGKYLGSKLLLTPEEAALGRLIIPTYVRQIGSMEAFKTALSAVKEVEQ